MKTLLLQHGDPLRAVGHGDHAVLRSGAPFRRAPPDGGNGAGDPMTGGLAILLVASLIRIIPPLLGREVFGTEPTLARFAIAFSGQQLAVAALGWWRHRTARRRCPKAPDADGSSDPGMDISSDDRCDRTTERRS